MFLISKDSWEIKKTKEKGRGVFAKKKIKAGTVIADYGGKVIRLADFDPAKDQNNLYLMYLTDEYGIYPDLKIAGPHLINHACYPNCFIYLHHGHTLFFALRDIYPSEELTIHYLLHPLEDGCKNCTHICKCGSENCTKTMHLPLEKYLLWQKFLNKQMKKTTKKKFTVGKYFPSLASYPESIPIDPIYALICSP